MKSIALPCTDENKVTEMTPPYGITYESVTTDIGTLANRNGPRKVDARMYNGYLIIPGLVYHLLSKMKMLVSTRFSATNLKSKSSTSLQGTGIIRGKLHMSLFMARIPDTLR